MPRRKTLRKRTKRKRTRKGGVRLGSGMHGVVIYPGIACEGKDPNTYATKVLSQGEMNEDYDEAKMKQVSAILKSIDPEQEYFLYPDFCETKQGPLTKENEEDIKGPRENYEEGYYDTFPIGEFKSYNVQKGEESFKNKWKETKNYWKMYREAATNTTLEAKYRPQVESYLQRVTPDAKHLVQGLRKLHAAGILHGDIQAGNIVYMKDGKPRFIDFEECTIKKISKKEKEQELQELIQVMTAGDLEEPYPELYDEFRMNVLS